MRMSRKLMLIVLVGMVNGRGYDDQQKDAIYNVHELCQMI